MSQINDLDYAINKLFREQEAMKAQGRENEPEYGITLEALQILTRQRCDLLGLRSVAVPQPEVAA